MSEKQLQRHSPGWSPSYRNIRCSTPRLIALEMIRLPPELLQLVLSLLDHHDLWVLVQVSRFFQQLALPSLLSRHNITPLQIHSGSVCVRPGAYFLIPRIYLMRPIQHLTIQSEGLPLRGLAHIIRKIPSIADVLLYVRVTWFEDPELAEIVATSSRGGRDPIVVAHGSLDISHPRSAPRIQGLRYIGGPWMVEMSGLADWEWVWGCIIYLPVLFISITINIMRLLYNYLVAGWTYRRVLRPSSNPAQRIAADFHWVFGDSIRIQTISVPGASQFTLLTVPLMADNILYFCKLRGSSSAQFNALLATLDLTADMPASPIVGSDCRLDIHNFFVGSLYGPAHWTPHRSAPQLPHPARITFLCAPAKYMPHVWPFLPDITHLDIDFAGDASQLAEALAAIAASSTRLSELILSFGRPKPRRQSLPWRRATVPPLMRGITRLTIYAEFAYGGRDAESMPRWLARFPDLQRIELRCGTSIPVSSRAGPAESIAATRANLLGAAWAGVEFTS
ncbi:hypothetical protein B0H16DRAFT_1458049 [Mycena metata]|uniref:F-box domain-containing protein n=1 Tax=Mycena metata TaxID=1033252 RepID=A0AAD7J592_9AGAR|nr:hypothetical protein B0H16DRAFT_1458049 [Mycena metata]